jgi:hypothetical protein
MTQLKLMDRDKLAANSEKKVAKIINPDYLIYGEKHNVGDSH